MNQLASNPIAGSKYKIIDADTHLTERHDLWISRAPASLKDRVPQVKEVDGVPSWIFNGDTVIGKGASAASAILADGGKARSFTQFAQLGIDDVHPGSWSLKERLAYMDENGIWAQIVYPNILGFSGTNTSRIDPDLRLVTMQIFNDAMAEMQAESGGRVCPMALLPWWDPADAAAEMKRCIDLGLKGININPTPYLHKGKDGQKLPGLGHSFWDPLWDLCQQTRMPVNFHIGSSETTMDWLGSHGWPELNLDQRWAIGGSLLFFENAQSVGNIIFSGLLDRFENLSFVSVESGIGWLPYVLEAFDYQYRETSNSRGLKRQPSQYFTDNFHGCFWFESRNICTTIRSLGVDNCMFQTDFPHPTCVYPLDDVAARLADFDEMERYKVMFGNCARVYSIDLRKN